MSKRGVRIRGVRYASISEAARALGVSRQAVHKAKQRGQLDYVGLGTGSNPKSHIKPGSRVGAWRAKSIKIRGVIYPSQAAAAKALGLTPGTISIARKRGTLNTVATGKHATRKRM